MNERLQDQGFSLNHDVGLAGDRCRDALPDDEHQRGRRTLNSIRSDGHGLDLQAATGRTCRDGEDPPGTSLDVVPIALVTAAGASYEVELESGRRDDVLIALTGPRT